MPENLRQEFENWMLSIEHPVIGWITRQWLERGEDAENYANDYVQGAWTTYRLRPVRVEQAPQESLAARMKAAGMYSVDELLSGTPIDRFIVHNGVTDLVSFGQWIEMKRREYVSIQARLTLDKRDADPLFEWTVSHAAVFGEVMVNFKAATATETEKPAWN
ncbi:hypothetical protein GIW05_00550 [Pseudomonas syringae]|uniref:hypothetical protein n=1 Tax=Pseudomonas syringae TaxID=317 RepID=UPI001F3224AC|nr:hypothetical protein [Pseudomonas syringae]MCF5382011.1 hypothetical protein [Pseudomonas syringae]MCF5419456.1 hypothetical protein [Pseudomonas syringae]MCF5452002.1 hypothetical protein [Pseudomonas syringae]MCF5456289.1 hypothetical protein [Pseudomonas syringae]